VAQAKVCLGLISPFFPVMSIPWWCGVAIELRLGRDESAFSVRAQLGWTRAASNGH
jgi:hypothetical protein